MKITMQTYRPFEVNKLADGVYTATIFGNPVAVSRFEEDGTERFEHEVEVFHTDKLPVSSLEEAEAFVQDNFQSILTDLIVDRNFHQKLKQQEEASQYLRSTDYRTLKAVRELPEVQAKLEELYPGEMERNRKAAEVAGGKL